MKSCKCPICKGSGMYILPQKMQFDIAYIKKSIVIKLHKKGYSIRQIQKALEYKSPHSVHLIIKQIK